MLLACLKALSTSFATKKTSLDPLLTYFCTVNKPNPARPLLPHCSCSYSRACNNNQNSIKINNNYNRNSNDKKYEEVLHKLQGDCKSSAAKTEETARTGERNNREPQSSLDLDCQVADEIASFRVRKRSSREKLCIASHRKGRRTLPVHVTKRGDITQRTPTRKASEFLGAEHLAQSEELQKEFNYFFTKRLNQSVELQQEFYKYCTKRAVGKMREEVLNMEMPAVLTAQSDDSELGKHVTSSKHSVVITKISSAPLMISI